jgi:hypothetical protein
MQEWQSSQHFDVITHDWNPDEFHDRVLSKLFCVVGTCVTAQNEPLALTSKTEVLHAPAKFTLNLAFNPIQVFVQLCARRRVCLGMSHVAIHEVRFQKGSA